MKVGVVVFPGTNCDRDTKWAFEKIGAKVEFIWHTDKLKNYDLIVLPGGFSYGDYLRSGAIARFSPIMKDIENFAKKVDMFLEYVMVFKYCLNLIYYPEL